MKKYLMTGMAALAISAAFTSCSHDDDIEVYTQEQITGAKYTQAFEGVFGSVNPNVNWGFDNQTVYTIDADGNYAGTRGFTRGSYPNSNQWGMYINVPTEMTQAQKDKVTKFFTEKELHQGISVNWTDFFVHNVSSTDKGPYMNQLCCGTNDFAIKDHVFNFNAGSSTSSKNVGVEPIDANNARQETYTDGIQLVQNSSTELFAFHNSYDNNWYENNFIMISGEMIDAAYPEAPSVAGMYFVGFDYQHSIDGRIENRDYYFNDWVIRVSPGFYKNSKRVMVEDLIDGSLDKVDISDWDFNDAVFDVAFVNDAAVITLWAAGGTKNLTVGGKEVHTMFGQPISKMINTNAAGGVDGLAPVIFRVPAPSEPNANLIPVYVNNTELKATKGEATQKFACTNTTRWMKERKLITGSYTKFKEYVQNDEPKDWYNTVTNTGNLY